MIGGILAELTQARAVADRLTRALVDEYEDDPVLSGMSVPRVKLSAATVTVRYTIQSVEESEPTQPDPAVVSTRWQKVVAIKVVPKVLRKLNITGEDQQALTTAIVIKRPTVTATEHALQGKTAEFLNVTIESAMESWPNIPAELQRRLGGKLAFRGELKAEATAELEKFLDREARERLLASVLASKIHVGVLTADLPEEPGRIQEIQLTVAGEDLELVELADQDGQ
ncbi:hypothetical protein [Nocardia amamiensis]|uniref:hypothetical protein n=1 Tax=Nocardia amamiensis TaxID=404578 RepID=UPI000830AA6E|nr:hypothetical protein [Nocardia amamiensis]